MVKHVIKGKTCSVAVDIPNYWDNRTKRIITTLMRYCIDKPRQKAVLTAVTSLMNYEKVLFDIFRRIKEYDPILEHGIRGFTGMHLNHGFMIGQQLNPEATKAVEQTIQEQFDYRPLIKQMPKAKQYFGEFVFYCLNLGRLAYETGYILSLFVSKERVEKNVEELTEELSYIG
jgi:hypothetical protein